MFCLFTDNTINMYISMMLSIIIFVRKKIKNKESMGKRRKTSPPIFSSLGKGPKFWGRGLVISIDPIRNSC